MVNCQLLCWQFTVHRFQFTVKILAMFRSCLFITIYLLPFFLSAQRNPVPFQEELVYPIRKDHKVGYLYIKDDYSTICPSLPPKFDYIGETPIPWNTTSTELVESSFRLFSIDEKVGLIGQNLKEVIPNKYKRIRPISEDYFAVEIDSQFVLIDRTTKVIDLSLIHI